MEREWKTQNSYTPADQEYVHGGDIFDGTIDLDLSVNTNPLGMPERVRKAVCESAPRWEEYPDIFQRRLRAEMAGFLEEEGFSVPASQILFGNGASDLLYSIFAAVRPSSVLIPAPGFSEYRKAAESVGTEIRELTVFDSETGKRIPDELVIAKVREFTEEAERRDPDFPAMIIFCNPNNPDGQVRNFKFFKDIFEICQKYGMIFLVDESFLWFCEERQGKTALSLGKASATGTETFYIPEGLIILNAFTKIFAMAGLRLGFMVADKSMIRRAEALRQPWSISVPAEAAGIACMKEREYVERSVKYIGDQRKMLVRDLRELGLFCAESEADYVLFRSEMTDLDRKLRARGILIRNCANYSGLGAGWFRVSVKTGETRERLIGALRDIVGR